MVRKNLNTKKGITLVALVITIVILIILAGVALSLVLGSNGILQRTKDAKTNYTNASAEEGQTLANLEQDIGSYLGEGGESTSGGTLPTGAGTTPYLPSSDYTQVSGTDLKTGLVIEDKSGNQYVWVEVPTSIYTDATYANNTSNTNGANSTGTNPTYTVTSATDYTGIENILKAYTSTYRNSTDYDDVWYAEEEYDTDAGGTTLITENTTGLTDTQKALTNGCGLNYNDYISTRNSMLSSVYIHGGFWVGRYEAGIDTNRTSDTEVSTPMVTKANQYPYICVTCSESETLAKAVAPSGYNSSLLFGVQWDLVLKYLETKKAATQDELNEDSTSWENCYYSIYNITSTLAQYSEDNGSSWTATPYNKTASDGSILLTTGASDTFSKMNIYDIAGNVEEWTMEYTDSSIPCAFRGGCYASNGSPASYRYSYNTISSNYIGFRVALY